jgi:hypothetical protein
VPSHGAVAAKVRQDKEQNPARYCADDRCLWRTADKWCPRHATTRKRRETLLDPPERNTMASWNQQPRTYAGVPDSALDPRAARNILDELLQDAEDVQQYDHDEDEPC